MLAARRATEGGASSAVLLVLLATATVAAFAAVSLDSLDTGADMAAWQSIGGSYRLQAPTGRSRATSTRRRCRASRRSPACSRGPRRSAAPADPSRCSRIADSGPMATALAGTPADPQFPTASRRPAPGPIPAIISTELADGARGVKLGEDVPDERARASS